MGVFSGLIRKIRRGLDPVKQARRDGVRVGTGCRLIGSVTFGSEPYLIKLGDHVSITSSSFITHDGGVWVFREEYPDIDVLAPIEVGSNVFIGAHCVILPGVKIGDNVVVGAGAVVTKSLEGNAVYAGVPARKVKELSDYRSDVLSKSLDSKRMEAEEKKAFLLKMLIK